MAPERVFDLFLLEQPHNSSDQPSKVSGNDFTKLTERIDDDDNFLSSGITAVSEWRKQGDRVWSRTYRGSFADNEAIYDLRRRELPEYLAGPSIDVVALPLDPSWERAKGSSGSSNSSSSNDSLLRPIKLAVFDMDSTLIEQEVIDELARVVGKYEQVAEITERAMQGHLDFAGSLRERVALLRGLPLDVWERVRPRISFAAGARQLCRELRRRGVVMAVLSGGFTPLAEWVKAELGLDVAHANFLDSDAANQEFPFAHLNGKLVHGRPIVTAERKRELLLALAEERGVALSEVMCVGDGANDLKMMECVGEGGGVAVALKAKPKVQLAAPNKLNPTSMTDLLYLLGDNQDQVEAVCVNV